MTWMSVRLELANTPEFPDGSVGRAYLLHVPIDNDGLIDAHECERHVEMATVRRFWPNEADRAGYLLPTSRGWAFAYRQSDADDQRLDYLGNGRFVVGNNLTITDPVGTRLPFRVSDVTPIAASLPASRRQRRSEAPRESS